MRKYSSIEKEIVNSLPAELFSSTYDGGILTGRLVIENGEIVGVEE